jgi:hypothetical protein
MLSFGGVVGGIKERRTPCASLGGITTAVSFSLLAEYTPGSVPAHRNATAVDIQLDRPPLPRFHIHISLEKSPPQLPQGQIIRIHRTPIKSVSIQTFRSTNIESVAKLWLRISTDVICYGSVVGVSRHWDRIFSSQTLFGVQDPVFPTLATTPLAIRILEANQHFLNSS